MGILAFAVSMIVLFAVAFIFILAIDKIAKDPFIAKIAKVAVGALALIVFVQAIASVLGLGGGAASVSPGGIIVFAIAVLVVIAVLYLIDLLLPALAGMFSFPQAVTDAILYCISIAALIALMYFAAAALLGGYVPGADRVNSSFGFQHRSALDQGGRFLG